MNQAPKIFVCQTGLLAGIFLIFFAGPLQAQCRCPADYSKLSDRLNRAQVVFLGKALSLTEPQGIRQVDFQVFHLVKGQANAVVSVQISAAGYDSARCGYDVVLGEDYLVYAYGASSDQDDVLSADPCGGVKKVSEATFELQDFLKKDRPISTELDRAIKVKKNKEQIDREEDMPGQVQPQEVP